MEVEKGFSMRKGYDLSNSKRAKDVPHLVQLQAEQEFYEVQKYGVAKACEVKIGEEEIERLIFEDR